MPRASRRWRPSRRDTPPGLLRDAWRSSTRAGVRAGVDAHERRPALAAVRRLRQGDRVVPGATEARLQPNRVEGPVAGIDRHVEQDVAGSNRAGVFSQPQKGGWLLFASYE
jgi:hypothetical protein